MQTFLPYASFVKSAECLDNKRLGKQRIEAWQLLQSLTVPDYGWVNHPASKMWCGFEPMLADYGFFVCLEWINRGFKDTMLERFTTFLESTDPLVVVKPTWLGNEAFHRSHRSNLLRKMPEHYRKFGWSEPNDIPYVWPLS